ncbi:hypothetical protein COCNU_scaffold011802G000010 [Cocos nucifera]|nr:hypothetical protein [Cocos nucifera]
MERILHFGKHLMGLRRRRLERWRRRWGPMATGDMMALDPTAVTRVRRRAGQGAWIWQWSMDLVVVVPRSGGDAWIRAGEMAQGTLFLRMHGSGMVEQGSDEATPRSGNGGPRTVVVTCRGGVPARRCLDPVVARAEISWKDFLSKAVAKTSCRGIGDPVDKVLRSEAHGSGMVNRSSSGSVQI